jgi:hypothetical protein
MNKCTERVYNGLIKENPTFVLMLGMCPTLAVTTSAINGVGMGLFHIRSASTAGKVPHTGLCTRRVHFGQILIDMSGHSTARVVYSA